LSIQTHELWQLLHEKAETQNRNISSTFETEVKKICQYGVDLSKTIRDNFQTYTLHDETHILNLMTNMIMLLGDFKNRLTRDECAMLIMGACCHDIGMSVTQEEKEYLRSNPDCMQKYLNSNDKDYIIAHTGSDSEGINITDEIIQHYIRTNHHKRVRDKLQEYMFRNGNIWPVALGNAISMHDLCQICQSHGESANGIKELQSFSSSLDLRLCAILLRLGDILDFDTTRAPDSLYQYINLSQQAGVENEKSRNEWKKHQSSRGFTLSQDAHQMPILLYKADCANIQTERAIIAYLDWVDAELNACWELIPYTELRWRDLILPTKMKRSITINGYLSGEYKFTLDQEQVLNLLTGQNVYTDPAIFVRELIQNAIDAIRTRKQLDKNLPKNWFPQINIRTWMDRDGAYWFCIEDNGIGMTEQTLRECFLKVGCSYYHSNQFQVDRLRSQSDPDYRPISHFGIGLLSCFMGDADNCIEVTTRHFQEYDTPNPAYRLSMRGTSGYYHLSNSFDHQITAPKMPNSSISFITKPGTMIAVRTNLFQAGGLRSLKEIMDQYVVYPEVSIHYEAEESDCVCDYLSEEKFLEELHCNFPKPEDGIYKPIKQIEVSDEVFQNIQDCYPEILWEERPRVDIYCLPLDYFSHSSLIKGVTMVAKASGKAIWQAEGLDEKHIPTVELRLTPVFSSNFPFMNKQPRLIIEPHILNENRNDLKKRIIPQIKKYLLESGINIYLSPFTFAEIFSSISLEKTNCIQGVTFEEFRAFQQTENGHNFFVWKDDWKNTRYYKSWFEQYFKFRNIDSEGNLSVCAHNGIFADDSQLLVFGNSVISYTICLLKDRYCPDFNLARNRIFNLPLETICQLDVITDRIMDCISVYDNRFSDRELQYCYRDASTRASLKEYIEIFKNTPELLYQLHFLTEFGVETIESLETKLDRYGKVYIYTTQQIRPIYMAALMYRFNLVVDTFQLDYERRILAIKSANVSVLEDYLDFPPALFLPSTQKCDSILAGYDKYGLRSGKPYSATHPFAVWLIHNRKLLQTKAPGIYTQIILILINGFDIVRHINESLNRLRQIPKLGIEVFRDLSHDDFCTISSDMEYWDV
jgi:hypothetical protein